MRESYRGSKKMENASSNEAELVEAKGSNQD
jgi:hypothetical protein